MKKIGQAAIVLFCCILCGLPVIVSAGSTSDSGIFITMEDPDRSGRETSSSSTVSSSHTGSQSSADGGDSSSGERYQGRTGADETPPRGLANAKEIQDKLDPINPDAIVQVVPDSGKLGTLPKTGGQGAAGWFFMLIGLCCIAACLQGENKSDKMRR